MKTEKFEQFIAALNDIDANDIYSMFGRYATREWSPDEYIQYLEKLYKISKEAANEVIYNLPIVNEKDSYVNIIIHQIANTIHEYPSSYINYFNVINFEEIDLYTEEELDAFVIDCTETFSEIKIKQSVWYSFVIYFFTIVYNPFLECEINISSKISDKYPEVFGRYEIENIDPFFGTLNLQQKITKNNKLHKTPLPFNVLLINCREEELISALKDKYWGVKGKRVAAIIRALRNSNFISPTSNEQIYESMKQDLWDIGSTSAINKALKKGDKGEIKDEDVQPIVEFISEYKKEYEK